MVPLLFPSLACDMNPYTQAIRDDMGTLAEDARALFNATSDVAEAKVVEARKRLAAALDDTRDNYGRLCEKAIGSAKSADQTVRDHLYATIGIAFGIGVVFGGILVNRR